MIPCPSQTSFNAFGVFLCKFAGAILLTLAIGVGCAYSQSPLQTVPLGDHQLELWSVETDTFVKLRIELA